MRIRAAAASLVLAAAVVHGFGVREAEARTPLVVKKFLLGTLEDSTYRFRATGARGTQNAYRDNVVMLVFSGPVDLDSFDGRTVRIGIPSENGLLTPADGSFYRYAEWRLDQSDPSGYAYYPRRVYRNRVLFDPTLDLGCPGMGEEASGFRADTSYTVEVPGVDGGARRTVTTTDGTPVGTTFTTTFRTTDEFYHPFFRSAE